MSIQKPPSGTRGSRPAPGAVARVMTPLMTRIHRLTGNRFGGMDLVYLTTVGARSGQTRTVPLARFDDPAGGWNVVASAGGTATHPAWYHNLVAHPDQVWAEVAGTKQRVEVTQLAGAEREQAWARVVARAPRFNSYTAKTDRELPLLRLTPSSAGD